MVFAVAAPARVWMLAGLALIAGCGERPEAPRARGGVIDVAAWDFGQHGNIGLVGEWRLHWGRLLEPADAARAAPGTLFSFPGKVNGLEVGGERLSGQGHGTFTLTVRLGEASPPRLALKTPNLLTAYRLYVDGRLLSQNGVVSRGAEGAVPQWRPDVVVFEPQGDTVSLVLQASNHHYRQGSLRTIRLGTDAQIRQERDRGVALDAIMALFPGDVDDALRAATGLLQALEGFNQRRAAGGEAPVAIGVGVHRGEVMIGTVGESRRIESTVISKAVNLAARLEGLTKEFGVSIVISEETMAAVEQPSRYRIRPLGAAAVKGMSDPVSVVELVP